MTKKTKSRKKSLSPEKMIQAELVNIFDSFCRRLSSRAIQRGLTERKKKVLANAKRSYNKRNLIK